MEKYKHRSLPPMKTLQGFEAVARLMSFRSAADELNLSHQAISNQISLLEQALEQQLFLRSNRQIELTQYGKKLYPVVRNCLSNLCEICDEIRDDGRVQPLKIHTHLTVALRWLSTRLPEFKTSHPDIELELISTIIRETFDEENADLGVLFVYKVEPPPKHLHYIPVFSPQLYPVCHPNLISDAKQSLTPEDLLNYPLLHINSERWQWQQWFEALGYKDMEIKHAMNSDSTAVALEMALDGEGIALVYSPLIDKDLQTQRLIRPVPDFVEGIGNWGLVCRKDKLIDTRVSQFIAWFKEDTQQYFDK